MPGNRGILLSALAVAACGLALAACGDDTEGTIPESAGRALLNQLEQVQEQVEAGECDAAHATALAFAESVDQLPEDVDPELRDALVDASANLEDLSQSQCTPETGATGDAEAIPETPEPAPEETTPETEAPEDTEDDDEGRGRPDKPDKGNNNGNGPPENGPPPQDDNDDGDDGEDGDTGGIGGES